ncbi:hypothetical protein D8674_037716 [Pyrus ussuriensis x Pyrus communis]|uniref:Exopolygalacturonase-like n=1 Tax=Pyrus ussuriensis x Pyrus communis TaxID=2448454 RepID=A0A5N5GYN3_9ROSA|nr:hypothetical protein D8674_037716 [Pyrus ussuriensis x Pyrus communis]
MARVASCFCRVAPFMILYILHQLFVAESTLIFNVLSFGDKPNGVTDSTQVFLDAWRSLGKDLEEEGVQNVTVKDAIFKGGQNGLRIKSWARPSHGFVQGVQFLDAVMLNVQNPIVIDQNYCPHNLNCPGQV